MPTPEDALADILLALLDRIEANRPRTRDLDPAAMEAAAERAVRKVLAEVLPPGVLRALRRPSSATPPQTASPAPVSAPPLTLTELTRTLGIRGGSLPPRRTVAPSLLPQETPGAP